MPDDIESIIAIDAKAVGEAKPEYWRHKLSPNLSARNSKSIGASQLALVAQVNSRVAGFMIAEIRSWEFRQPQTGWITALAVDLNYRRQSVARRLLAEALEYFRERKLENVRTMVEWSDGEVLSFFTAMGFDRGPFIELEKKLTL